jgi:hypothetical protein
MALAGLDLIFARRQVRNANQQKTFAGLEWGMPHWMWLLTIRKWHLPVWIWHLLADKCGMQTRKGHLQVWK